MKIVLSGGGTIGSVSPLLAVAEKMPTDEFLFIGTKHGPEKKLIEDKNIKFDSILSGKFRRYFSIKNLIDIVKIEFACWQSLFILRKYKPDVIVSAGGFVSVPVVWAGYLLRVPVVIHSQDIKTGLAIKLMRPFAKKITKVFADTDLDAEVVGNPVRSLEQTTDSLKLDSDKPVVLITGGGTGAEAVNRLVNQELLKFAQVIHITGKHKKQEVFEHKDYQVFEFLSEEMKEALVKADLVITRAGIGTLSELAYLGKTIVIIPIPDSHQEANAKYFSDHQAAIVLKQESLDGDKLNQIIKDLLDNQDKASVLSENIKKLIKPDAAEKLAAIISKIT